MPINRKLRMAMVGGGRGAFIGAVHRAAARLDGEIELVAGAFSSTPEKSIESGRELGIEQHRSYGTWQDMLEYECEKPQQSIDFVTIVTPNHSHFDVARSFAERGVHLVIDKPMVTTVEQAEELVRTIRRRNVTCCVTYNYSGYPMVKQAREMVRNGEIGDVRKIVVEYNQGWLATRLETTGQKQAAWRADPQLAGLGGAIADIGTHAQHLVTYVSGLEIESVCADLNALVDGRKLDDDANMLLRFKNGARGVLIASQVCVGERNNLRLRIWGTRGGIEWHQENPNHLVAKSIGKPDHVLHAGEAYLCDAAKNATRLPPGHPEAFIEAFANLYRGFACALRGGSSGMDFPNETDGLHGVRFIHAALQSSRNGGVWTQVQ